jgi:hypothetical protein
MFERNLPPDLLGVHTHTGGLGANESAFFNNMIMYGWLASAQQRVYKVNDSLLDWMTNNGLADLANEVATVGVDMKTFLRQILKDPDGVISGLVNDKIKEVITKVRNLDSDLRLAEEREEEEDEKEVVNGLFLQKSIRIMGAEKVLAGIRVVKTGAIRMQSSNERDRVDIISVLQIVRSGSGWDAACVQGQLQQAWIRVKAGIRAGTQTGTLGLMGRNMSHNIGSHALFYLETDEEQPEKRNFYRYLRERMELLAGFSTFLSLSSTTMSLKKLVVNFQTNTALLDRIVRSEGVKNVTVNFVGEGRFDGQDCKIALPAGVLGAQALYTILENNIRDSAKHGRRAGSNQNELTINVTAREPADPELAKGFIEVVVSDTRGNYDDAGPLIGSAIENLRIVDELGVLLPGNWGIKERFIAAAILRGIRLETISVREDANRNLPVNLAIGNYEPSILRVRDVDGNLGWIFYVMKPKNILLIGRPAFVEPSQEYDEEVSSEDMKWLREHIDDPAEVRHQFVVICAGRGEELAELEGLRDKLPYRVFVCPPPGVTLPDDTWFAPIAEESLTPERLSPTLLYSEWVAWLVRQKQKMLTPPPAATLLQKFKSWFHTSDSRTTPEVVFSNSDPSTLTILTPDDSPQGLHWQVKSREKYRPDRPVILFDWHGASKKRAGENAAAWTEDSELLGTAEVHYEPHESNELLRQTVMDTALKVSKSRPGDCPVEPTTLGFICVEAALLKVLIVDERLDPVSEEDFYETTSNWSCSYKELFGWKGVDIKGAEYGGNAIPGRDTLIEWTKNQGYDFILLHKGIVDKLIKHSTTTSVDAAQAEMSDLFMELKKYVRHIVIHSGRMSMKDLPPGCKFMSLSNVDTWLRNNNSKLQIIEDICLLRRV